MNLLQINTNMIDPIEKSLSEIGEMELILIETLDRLEFHVAWVEIESSCWRPRNINNREISRIIHPPTPSELTPGFIIKDGGITFIEL